jgi:hypothetical protein
MRVNFNKSRFYYGKNAYIQDNWNRLDFIIVSSSLIAVIL